MNTRLLTPGILLVSFGVALGLTGQHSGAGHAAVPIEPVVAASAPSPAPLTAAVTPAAAPLPKSAAAAPAAPPTAPQPLTEDDTSAAMQAQESDGFLDARDRAAEHGARSH